MTTITLNNAVDYFTYWEQNVESGIRSTRNEDGYFAVKFNVTMMLANLEDICKAIKDAAGSGSLSSVNTCELKELKKTVDDYAAIGKGAAEKCDDGYFETYVSERVWQTPFQSKWNEIITAITSELNEILSKRASA